MCDKVRIGAGSSGEGNHEDATVMLKTHFETQETEGFGNVEHLPRKAAGTSRARLGGQLHGLQLWGCRGGDFQAFGVHATPT